MQDKSAKNVNVTGSSLKVFSRSEAAFFRWYTVYVFSNRRFEKERFTGGQIVEILKQISSSCYYPFLLQSWLKNRNSSTNFPKILICNIAGSEKLLPTVTSVPGQAWTTAALTNFEY
jgi:hypothetical protein